MGGYTAIHIMEITRVWTVVQKCCVRLCEFSEGQEQTAPHVHQRNTPRQPAIPVHVNTTCKLHLAPPAHQSNEKYVPTIICSFAMEVSNDCLRIE